METAKPFKVIIVGAGVTGLTLAHCLVKAGIDFVLLDKGVVGPPFGTTITLQPHGCRILHQLDCLDTVIAGTSYMGGAHFRTPEGKSYAHNDFFGMVKKYAGYDTRTLDRQQFLRRMYDLLPDACKANVFEQARVERVVETNSLVRVFLADGREFQGDLVVGADGVHSKMREIMWDSANSVNPGMISVDEKRAMVTTYNAIVALSKPTPGIGKHDMEVISNDKFSFLLLCQPDWISFVVHAKLADDEQCRWPNRQKFSQEDMDTMARNMASCPINESVVFGELWKNRTKAQMISLEEGVLDHWFFRRIVLAGDAIHKVTPNSALGGNTGMEDAVVIANGIYQALAAHPNKKPTDNEMRDALQYYQDSRLERVKAIVKIGGDMTRGQAYDGWKFYAIQRWLTPLVGLDSRARGIAELCCSAPKLSFVQFDQQRGELGWECAMASQGARRVAPMAKATGKMESTSRPWADWDGTFESAVPVTVTVLGIFSVVVWLFLLVQSGDVVPGFAAQTDGNVSDLVREMI